MPSSLEKTEANRKNAKRSTGPRSSSGRKRSSLNSTKHGLTGQLSQEFVRAWYKIILNDPDAEPDRHESNPRLRAALDLAEAEAWLRAIQDAEIHYACEANKFAELSVTEPPSTVRELRSAINALTSLSRKRFKALIDGDLTLKNKLAMAIIQKLRDNFSNQGLSLAEVSASQPELAATAQWEIMKRRIEQTFAALEKPPPILRYRNEAESRRSTRLKRWIALQG